MSKRRDKERFLKEGPRPRSNNSSLEERVVVAAGREVDRGPWDCFLCGSSITAQEADSLTSYAQSKPKFIVNRELGRMNTLLKGHNAKTSRICSKCYKEKVEV